MLSDLEKNCNTAKKQRNLNMSVGPIILMADSTEDSPLLEICLRRGN
jgi:hypothetical protein